MEWPLSIALVVALLLCAKLFQGSRAARKAHIAEQVLRDSRIHEQEQVMAQQASQNFLRQQVNKVNPRKEFFRLGLEDIRQELENLGVETHWTMTARAHEYRESLRIEQQILENPEIEREWTRHQLEVEAVVEEEELVS